MELFTAPDEQREEELPGQLVFFPEQQALPEQPPQESNTSEDFSVTNSSHVCILICDILSRFEGTLPEAWLYEIMVSSGHINYFSYADAVGFLIECGSVISMKDGIGDEQYVLTERGVRCAKSLRYYVPKLFRDQVLVTAIRTVNRRRALRDMQICYEPDEKGCVLCVKCLDQGCEMLSLRIHAPSEDAAIQLGELLLRNPVGIFGKILDLVLHNEEEQIDLTDN